MVTAVLSAVDALSAEPDGPSLTLVTDRVTACVADSAPSEAITSKLYVDLASKLAAALIDTAPVLLLMSNRAASAPERLYDRVVPASTSLAAAV